MAGAAFGGLVGGGEDQLRLTSWPRTLLLGAIYGPLLWVYFSGSLVSYQLPRWESMYSMDAGSLAGHLLLGVVVGRFTHRGAPAAARLRRCERCGESFESAEGLSEHRLVVHGEAPGPRPVRADARCP